MRALALAEVGKFSLREIPKPSPADREVLIQVGAVGICGTDLHIFHGLANYNRDDRGRPVSLTEHPQILGHEFCGAVAAVGGEVRKCKPGDRVVVDQVLNCWSQRRSPRCEYCQSGDSHQCRFGQQLGVTGLPGAFAEYVCVPEPNIVTLPAGIPMIRGALIEPLGCIVHAIDRWEGAQNRYTFDGEYRIRSMAILGAGPSGLLFLQYLRKVKQFDGEIFVVDMRDGKLKLAKTLGGTPIDIRTMDVISEINRRTHGEQVECVIEATGSGSVFDYMPAIIRAQGTVLLYGSGHSGKDIGCLTPLKVKEVTVVTSAGASGGFDADGTPTTYRRSMEFIRDGKIDPEPMVSHRYTELSQLQGAFARDAQLGEFIKGVLVLN